MFPDRATNAARSGNCFPVETAKILYGNFGKKLSKTWNFKCFHRIPRQKTYKITEGIFLPWNLRVGSQYI